MKKYQPKHIASRYYLRCGFSIILYMQRGVLCIEGEITVRYIIITKKQLTVIATCIVTVVFAVVCSIGVFANTNKKLPIYCVETEEKKVALSFDAAWGNDDTEQLIEILARYDAKATFFVVGAWVDKYPESVKQLSDAGHQIMNHSNTHPNMPALNVVQKLDELNSCNKKIAEITGKVPNLFRPPYGDYDNATIEACDSLGMYTIQWDVDSLDWKENATADSIYKRVTSKVTNGSIVLFHNDADHTPEALPRILETLKNDGYEFVFIDELIYKENYEIDHAGKQCKIKDGAN